MLLGVRIQQKPHFRAFQSWRRLGFEGEIIDPKSLTGELIKDWGAAESDEVRWIVYNENYMYIPDPMRVP